MKILYIYDDYIFIKFNIILWILLSILTIKVYRDNNNNNNDFFYYFVLSYNVIVYVYVLF